MARLVHRTEKKPLAVEVGGERKWICQCGLSRRFPFCDGSHRACADEAEGTLYRYDSEGNRTEIV